MYVVEVLLLVCTYIVCIVHMYVLLISGKTAQLKSLLANFFCLIEDQMFCLYSGAHISWHELVLAGNQGNNQNLVQSILTYKF